MNDARKRQCIELFEFHLKINSEFFLSLLYKTPFAKLFASNKVETCTFGSLKCTKWFTK